MATYKFASLSRSHEAGYALVTDYTVLWDACYRGSGHHLGLHFAEFATHGDGTTQHSPFYPVQDAHFADYLASLATWLLGSEVASLDDEARRAIAFCWPEIPDEAVRFALSVRHIEGKARYFNAAERKVSARASLAHDKRWHEIVACHDGSVKSALSVLGAARTIDGTLERFARFEAVGTVAINAGEYVPDSAAKVVLGIDDIPNAMLAYQAFRAASCAIEALRQHHNARRQLECYTSNAERAASASASEAAA